MATTKKSFGVYKIVPGSEPELVHAPYDNKKDAEGCKAHHERVYEEGVVSRENSLGRPGSLPRDVKFEIIESKNGKTETEEEDEESSEE